MQGPGKNYHGKGDSKGNLTSSRTQEGANQGRENIDRTQGH